MKSKREFFVVIEEGENGYYIAEVPQLRGCYTQARSLDELLERVREAITLCLEEEAHEEAGRPEQLRIIGIQKVTV